MSIPSIVTRLQKIHEGLMTISSLQRLKDMPGKRAKPCTCAHHRSPSRSRCPKKCSSHGNRDKSLHCSCSRERPKHCLCSRTSDDQVIIESSKRPDADDDAQLDSDFPIRPDRQIEVVNKDETTNLADRVGQKLPAGITSNDRIARTAARFDPGDGDGKPEAVTDLNRNAVASQTVDIVEPSKASDIDRLNGDRTDAEKMYKELMAEKNRNRELEEKLEKVNCNLQCLKIEGEEQAACLKDALEKAKIQARLASHSRNLAVDLAKQSRNQTDLVKASRDEVLSQINIVKCDNSKLQCECDELRSKLREISENEEKKCAEVDDKVNRIKCAVKQKEIALASEKSELEETVAELTRLVKEQKKRICDLTSICTKQRSALQEHENCIVAKLAQLSEAEDRIQSINCRCGSMDDEIEYLKCCLNEQVEARDKLQKEFDERQDNCNCELQIKDKIIADQVETIKKLKKLLQDSEKMAHQAAREFESLRDELHCLKQSNKSLRFALDEAEAQMSDECEIECCERCTILEAQLRELSQQKRKALIAAKCAAEKLRETTINYQQQLDCEKQQHSFVVDLLQRKETEIELLKHEIRHIKEFGGRRLNHCNQ